MLLSVSPLDVRICCLKICEPLHCLHVNILVNTGITVGIVRVCHDNKTVTAGNEGIFFVPLIILWVNWPQQLYRLSLTDTDNCSQYCCILFFCYQSPRLQRSLNEGDELFVEHINMRAQFLRQILHTFEMYCWTRNGTALLFASCPSGRGSGGREGTCIIEHANKQQYYQMGSQNECCHAKVGIFARLRGQGSRR